MMRAFSSQNIQQYCFIQLISRATEMTRVRFQSFHLQLLVIQKRALKFEEKIFSCRRLWSQHYFIDAAELLLYTALENLARMED